MSVVVAVKDKTTGEIIVGCDTQVSAGNLKSKLKGESSKIWRYNGLPRLIVGGVGLLRDIQLVQTCHDLIEDLAIYENTIDFEYCVTKLFTRIYKLMTDYNRISISKDGIPSPLISNKFLLAYQDSAYLIDYDGAVSEIDDYLVLGSGEEVAVGVLENNKTKNAKSESKFAILQL